MRKSYGFTILELMIAIALSSMVALVLYSILMQTTKTVFVIDEKTSYQMMTSTLYHQLEKDIYGIFVPTQFLVQLREHKKQKEKDTSTVQKQASQTQASQMQTSQTQNNNSKEKEKKIPLLKKIFYATSENDSFKQFTFITRNALAFYTDKDQKDITPLMVRVMYQLKPDEQNEGLFKLMRTQGTSLDPQDYDNEKKMRAYELARGIKKMKLIFYKQIPQKNESDDKKKDDASPTKSPVPEKSGTDTPKEQDEKKSVEQPKQFSKVAVWSTDELSIDSALIPAFVEVELIFSLGNDAQDIKEEKERFMFEIAVSDMAMIMQGLPEEPKNTSNVQVASATKNNEKVITQSTRPGNQGVRPHQTSVHQKGVQQRQGYGPRGYQMPQQKMQDQETPKAVTIIKTTTTPIKKADS